MRRVVILGPGASGKSTLAIHLGEITGLPVIELDKVFWRSGLAATLRDQWIKLLERLVKKMGGSSMVTWDHMTLSKFGLRLRIR